jgi:hypothetical protein
MMAQMRAWYNDATARHEMERATKPVQVITFRVGPDYTIAHSYSRNDCVTLDEWTGKTYEQFLAAMKREPDFVETKTICGRSVTEYTWN